VRSSLPSLNALPTSMSPAPKALVLLILLLPAAWHCGRYLSYRTVGRSEASELLAPGLGLAAWLLLVHACSLLLHSFYVGLPMATVLLCLVAVALPRFSLSPRPRIPWWIWLLALICTLPTAAAALRFNFHDEVRSGHWFIVSAIENNHYPPRHYQFPRQELAYHYGFDLFCACLTSLFRVSIQRAIDIATILLFYYSCCLSVLFGRSLGGARFSWLFPLILLFGGGLSFFADACTLTKLVNWASYCKVEGSDINPPIFSYFFQHPWGLGIPMFLLFGTIYLIQEEPRTRIPRFVMLWFLLVALSLSQFTLFLLLLVALPLAEPFAGRQLQPKRFFAGLAISLAALLAARLLHGFLTPQAPGFGAAIVLRPLSLARSLPGLARWHLATFGLVLPLGLAGALFLRARSLVLLVLVALGGLLIVNLFINLHSWDIVKFATASFIALALLSAFTIQRIISSSWYGAIAGIFLLFGTILYGSSFAAIVGFLAPPGWFGSTPGPLFGHQLESHLWLRHHVKAGDLLLSASQRSEYVNLSGLPQATAYPNLYFGLPEAAVRAQQELLRTLPKDIGPYQQQGIRWVVLDEPSALVPIASAWQKDGRAVARQTFGPIVILEIPPLAASPPAPPP